MNDSNTQHAGTLAQLERAEQMLAEVATASDALNIIDLAEVARVYAREAKLGTSAINHATSIKLRAERRLADVVDDGQARGEIATHGGDRKSDFKVRGADLDSAIFPQPNAPASLDEIGVTKQRLSEARTIRDNYTEDDIAAIVEEANVADEIVPRTDFVRKKAHVANNSGQNEWYTPAAFIEAARAVFDADFGLDADEDDPAIELDPASSDKAQETVQAVTYYTAETDGLAQEWSGRVWMNPPYAQPLIGQFIDKLVESYLSGKVPAAIVLVNNATETKWGQTLLGVATHVCFPKGRIRFIDTDGNPGGAPLQGQMIVYLGPIQQWAESAVMSGDTYEADKYWSGDKVDRGAVFAEEFGAFGPVLGG